MIATTPIPIPDGELVYYASVFDPDTQAQLFDTLYREIRWTQRHMNLYGRSTPMPRLTAWYADAGIHYAYSGGQEPRNDWIPPLLEIKQRVEQTVGSRFNGALLNLYRDGSDSVGWHSDNETSLGDKPVIASVSLGAPRRFRLQHKKHKRESVGIDLEPGSVLVMRGETQRHWRHQLPKTRRPVGPRINITFRHVEADSEAPASRHA